MQEILRHLPDSLRFTAFYKRIEPGILETCGNAIATERQFQGNMLLWRDLAVQTLKREGAKGVWFPTQFAAWRPAIASVATIHDLAAFRAWRSFSALGRLYMPTSILATCLNAKVILAISESTVSDLCRIFPWTRKKVLLARHGLPSDVRKASENINHRHRDGPLHLIFLDGANPRKRLDYCLQALERRGWAGIEMAVTGNPERVKARILKTLGRQPAEVTLVGHLPRKRLLEMLANADMLLYPSDFEGFGFPLIEAMAFGTTVVAFAGDAEKEIGGDFSIYAERANVDSLFRAILRASERCRDTSWKQSLTCHAHGFSWDESIQIHRRVFEDFAAG